MVTLTAVLSITTTMGTAVSADVGDSVVYLERDSVGRYRPTFDNAGLTRVLANMDSITAPAISPNSTRVAFSGSLVDGSLGRYAIYLVNMSGSNLTRLTSGNHGEFDPVWVNGGQSLIVSQNATGSITSSCCRLASVNVSSGQITALTGNIGAQRPAAIPNGSYVFFDTRDGVWRMHTSGGTRSLIAPWGYEATVSGNESEIAFVRDSGSSTHLRRVSASGGASTFLYSTPNQIENPVWVGDRIYFLEHSGLGYEGRGSVSLRSISRNGGSLRVERSFSSAVVGVSPGRGGDEMFFYRSDGLYRYYDIRPDGSLGSPIRGGTDYTSDWSSITSVNLDGDGDDEMFFYRADGLYSYYDIRADGRLAAPIKGGTDYASNWSAITAVDLDGDGKDEMFFYRADGLYRYYDIRADGRLGAPIKGGTDYTSNWSAITAVDLDGDGRDEMFFYRDDGLYSYYDIRADGRLGAPIKGGTDYASNWSAITAVDLDGDGQDEIFFYRADGLYRYYDIRADGRLGAPIKGGADYASNWSAVTSVRLPAR